MNKALKWIIAILANALTGFVIFQNALMIYLKSKGVAILIAYQDVAGLQLNQINASFFIFNILLAVISIAAVNAWIFGRDSDEKGSGLPR